MTYLVDTNVIFAILKGDAALKNFIDQRECAVDSTNYIECIQGSKSNHDKQVIHKLLSNYDLYYHAPEISKRAVRLIDQYSNSHGLMLPDAQIAATALVRELPLLTFNTSDFRFISGIELPDLRDLVASEQRAE